jgi:ribosome-binding factor A
LASKRILQVGEQIREHIAMMLLRGDLSDPRLKNMTINSVRVSPDLQIAKVYFSILGEQAQRDAAVKALKQASGFVRHSLGEALKLRYTPVVQFFFDESIERAARISEIIEKVKKEDREAAGETIETHNQDTDESST